MGDLEARWTAPAKPVNRELRRALGPLAKKRVLLLGNGGSTKELAFLAEKPELLVVTDLSVAGIDAICRARDLGPDADRVVFAAVDALDMPIADNSIDVIYASQLVHHLPDRRRFLAEVARVLRPGGRAVFADGASVPVWQAAKRTILGPLFRHSHRRYRRSPEDVRHTREGGFSERELIREIGELGCAPYHFQRVSLLFYLWHRATLVLFPPGLRSLGNSNLIGRPLTDLDRLLSRFSPFRQNQIVLVWGLEKPKAQ
jgi:SAM-dependent methyltransferase